MPAFCCFGDPARTVELVDAGWSSPVARQAHNLKVVGSNPTPATNKKARVPMGSRAFCLPNARRLKRPTDRPTCGGELPVSPITVAPAKGVSESRASERGRRRFTRAPLSKAASGPLLRGGAGYVQMLLSVWEWEDSRDRKSTSLNSSH